MSDDCEDKADEENNDDDDDDDDILCIKILTYLRERKREIVRACVCVCVLHWGKY